MNRDIATRDIFLTRDNPNALQGIFCSRKSIDLATRCPSRHDATTLWNIFYQRVNPLIRMLFSWALKRLHSASIDPESQEQLSAAEHAFIFSLYLISVVSLSDEECRRELHQSRSLLLSKFETLCEEAFSCTNLFCTTDIMVLKALNVYMVSCYFLKVAFQVH